LPQNCAAWNAYGLWDYDFKIQFASQDSASAYIRVPLSNFAWDDDDQDLCAIFVHYMPSWDTGSQ
jgi:hypothetical protein